MLTSLDIKKRKFEMSGFYATPLISEHARWLCKESYCSYPVGREGAYP
jgi:hypothetical protein